MLRRREWGVLLMIAVVIVLAVGLLGWSNGANDNFKGVASLFGSRTCGYRTALAWATATTFAGSLAALFVAQALVARFSGRGLVPDALIGSPEFVLAVAAGAGATVMLATRFGFPISTTHGLTGALVGAGLASGGPVHLGVLGTAFVLPLLLSPLLAVIVGAGVYRLFHAARIRLGVDTRTCLCAGIEEQIVPRLQPGGLASAQAMSSLSVSVDDSTACASRYTGTVLGVGADRLLNGLHFLSAGAVSFARGVNDTPKIAALLLVVSALDIRWGMLVVAVAMAFGGLVHARKVAETMSHRITDMNPGQGFASNLSTALLVTTASLHGLPASTTHVSVGSLLGMGLSTGQARWRPVLGVLAAWTVTLPCAAALAALAFLVARGH